MFPAGHTINHTIDYMPADQDYTNSTAMNTFWSPTYDPLGGGSDTSTIWAYLHLSYWASFSSTSAGNENRKKFDYLISGANITNYQSTQDTWFFGTYNWSSTSTSVAATSVMALAPVTLAGGNGIITYALDVGNNAADASCGILIHGGGGTDALRTHIQFVEVM